MATTVKFTCVKAKQTRRRDDGVTQGSSRDQHILSGAAGSGSTEYHYRSLMQFGHTFAGVRRVVKAELVLRTEDDSTHYEFGAKPRIMVSRLTSSFSEETNGENVWTSGEYDNPTATGTVELNLPINASTGKPQDNATVFVDITSIFKAVVPKSVLMADGTPGEGLTNYGFRVRSPGTESNHDQRAVMYSRWTPTTTARPYILLTYDPANRAPGAPTLLGPATTDVSLGDVFEGQHSDPDLDPMAARDIVVYPKGGSTATWILPANLQSAGSDETLTGRFSVPLSLATASLKLQTDYEWVARTKDPGGLWGPYSARRALRITSSAPSVVATGLTTVARMSDAVFGGTYSDPEGNDLAEFMLQMQPIVGLDWSDPGKNVWDTGETLPTLDEVTSKLIARAYSGRAIPAGDYFYRIRVKDSTGVWSAWSEDSFTLTTEYAVDPGDVQLTTQVARNAPVRVALYGMGALRAPGALIGYVDDPIDLGASAFLNGGGEMYFTLPALHPYAPYIEAHQTHYHVEQWYGDRYRVLFAGIITDFDADPDSVVYYGTDYVGLLQTAVDERFNPSKPDIQAPTGSRYVDKTIDTVIRDQLTYHKGLSNSPVGFITVGPMTALAERVTIYSTYTECLPFVIGLIDSHKQGTGREARFYAKPTSATFMSWQWTLVDNWGKDRPNIRLEYGGLLNDFRVVALGEFATRVLAVGQKRGEVRVFRALGPKAPITGLNEAQWGRRAATRFYPDIIDPADLQRRVNEEASRLSKIGKRMALAIKADVLAPFDGWDIGDNIVIDIERGVVDTAQYGSGGYWTIYGVEWRYFPDGHTELTLTIMPKKTAQPPDPDLIPSVNTGIANQWQVGYGVPTVYGEPPSPTPAP